MVTASGLALLFFQCKIRGANPKMHKRSEMQLFIQADVGYMRQLHSTSLFLSLQILGETFHKCLFIHSKNLFENLRKHIPL